MVRKTRVLDRNITGPKIFRTLCLLDYIASHAFMEIHGGILVLLVLILKYLNMDCFLNNFRYTSPVKPKAPLGKKTHTRSFFPYLLSASVHFSVSSPWALSLREPQT